MEMSFLQGNLIERTWQTAVAPRLYLSEESVKCIAFYLHFLFISLSLFFAGWRSLSVPPSPST